MKDIIASLYHTKTGNSLDWYDTDWLATIVAIAVGLLIFIVRRKFSFGASLILHADVGWWIGFGLLVLLFGLLVKNKYHFPP